MLKPLPDGKVYNFFIDDNMFFLQDITENKYKSLLDQFYLKELKQIHEEFGTCFTLNTFNRNWHDPAGFNLTQVPDTYKSEFADQSDWLRLAFHADIEMPGYPYSRVYPEKLEEHYTFWEEQIHRITGEKTPIAPVLLHCFEAMPEGRRFMRSKGMKIFGGRQEDPQGYNEEFDQYDMHVDAFLNLFVDDLASLRRTFEDKVAAGQQKILIGSHEQYAYKFYKNYIPCYFEQIRSACRIMKDNGYRCVYFSEVV